MNEKFLFVAEADKIQDLLFRSSKLREVAGGSQMLEDFCKNTASRLAEIFGGNIQISSGGSFRILFDEKEKAEKYGDYLAELYRRKFDETITVAKPVKVKSEREAIEAAQVNLRKAKHSGISPFSIEQIPYVATCASCGIGLAKYYKKRHEDEKENYLCSVCEEKFLERDFLKKTFLAQFYNYVTKGTQKDFDFPKGADTLAELEDQNYVAYIMADVNDMGVIFSSCGNFKKLKKLSCALDKVMQKSLAAPTKIIIETINNMRKRKQKKSLNFIPVLPLIMAGDDLFALIPAQWSLDFTSCFCGEFERIMKQSLGCIKIHSGFLPTISASVIICKGNFPYSLAYSLGEELLKVAKKTAKAKKTSHISFRVVTGSDTVKAPEEEQTFVASYPAYSTKELRDLIAHRLKLKEAVLPARRRVQLQNLFYRAEELQFLPGKTGFKRMVDDWLPEIDNLLQRLDEVSREKVRGALKELGCPGNEHYWQEIDGVYYHQLPDLLLAWEFTYDLTIDPEEYKRWENEA